MTRTLQGAALALAIASSCSTAPALIPSQVHPVPLAVPQSPVERARSEAFGKKFMVSTQGTASTAAAQVILKQGGNVIDAAVAASFTLAVERPQSTGIGGGGFLLYREAKTGKIVAFDFRERAPLRASETMFQDKNGTVDSKKSIDGILSVAVPGLVKGLTELQAKYGSLPLPVVMAPAIDLAEKGFEIYPTLAHALREHQQVLSLYPASRAIFIKPDGKPYGLGDVLVQKDLAKTLRLIADRGPSAFYQGEIARQIVRESNRLHGILEMRDFSSYKTHWREPVRGNYHGYEIVSMPPPSSGGALVIEILQILEHDPLKTFGPLSKRAIHLEASAMQLAFADRAAYLGDPDFVSVPVDQLTSQNYADMERRRIREDQETPSTEVTSGALKPPGPEEHPETTHFSILDQEGNAVASTQTINGYFGSGVVAEGTGIVLNDEMDDFSAKPGASNLFGAIGGPSNSIAPGKTPLSSMSPTLVLKEGAPILSIGAPGGTKIITCVAQTLINYLEFGLPLYDSTAALRFHHQWLPDELWFEAPGPLPSVANELSQMGYRIRIAPDGVPCRVMAVAHEPGGLHGVSDPRDAGSAGGD